jgi:hypothetical protein
MNYELKTQVRNYIEQEKRKAKINDENNILPVFYWRAEIFELESSS